MIYIGGGRDLLFPHHENELAQSEALTEKEFVKYWTHCGLLKINGEKMSKSLGNSLTIREALSKYNYEVIKYIMHSKHYTSDMDILDSDYQLAESQMYYFYSTIKSIENFISRNKDKDVIEMLENKISENITNDFIKAMDDDFNTVIAIANLHNIFKYANGIIKNAKGSNKKIVANTLEKILYDIKKNYSILGLFEQKPEEFIAKMKNKYLLKINMDSEYIESQIDKRKIAKEMKDFETADLIRKNLDDIGIILNDTKTGTTWDIKELYKVEGDKSGKR